MDPEANYEEQLQLAHGILDGQHVEENAGRLAELVLALHEWVIRGGFPPAVFAPKK